MIQVALCEQALTLIGLGLFDFDMLRFVVFFWGGGGGVDALIIYLVSGPTITKFCARINVQSVSSNMENNLLKINDIILLRPLLSVQTYT